MRRPRIHEQIASADETTTTKKKIGIAVRGQKGAADARTDRRRSNRSIFCRSFLVCACAHGPAPAGHVTFGCDASAAFAHRRVEGRVGG